MPSTTAASGCSDLPVLTSVGLTTPFVGLFGTVWGIYHALVSIDASGQASIGQVTGPVGRRGADHHGAKQAAATQSSTLKRANGAASANSALAAPQRSCGHKPKLTGCRRRR